MKHPRESPVVTEQEFRNGLRDMVHRSALRRLLEIRESDLKLDENPLTFVAGKGTWERRKKLVREEIAALKFVIKRIT